MKKFKPDTKLPRYVQYPHFLFQWELSHTAKLLYALLFDRTRLSLKNGWLDENGAAFVSFTIAEMAERLNRGRTATKSALRELREAGLLISCEHGGWSSSVYVMLPDEPENSPAYGRKSTPARSENRPGDGRKIDPGGVGKATTSNNNKNQNNDSQQERGTDASAYGTYGNVFLTDKERSELQTDIPYLDALINEMSCYMESQGKQYASHAATLRLWHSRKQQSSGKPDYSCEEGDSL